MTQEEDDDYFDEQFRKDVRDLITRQIEFSSDIVTLVTENVELRKELAEKDEELRYIRKQVKKIKVLILKKRKIESVNKKKI